MNDIRKLFREMGEEESSLEANQSVAYQKSIRATIAAIYLTNSIAAMGLFALAYYVIREMKLRARDARKVEDREVLLRTVTEQARVGLTMISTDRRYLYANAAYAEGLGLRTTDIIGRRVSDVLEHAYDQTRSQLDRAFAGKRVSYEMAVPAGLGTNDEEGIKFYAITCQPLRHPGESPYVIMVVVDITERKQAQEHLRRSEDQLRALAARLQTATESERLRIARDLHDELGQALTGMKMDLEWIVRKHGTGGGVWVPMVLDSMKIVDSTLALVRRLSTELRPEMLDAFGLPAAIEWHAEEFQRRTGIVCRVQVPEAPLSISADQKIAAFRIFQEALTNIARHAQAKFVLVTLEQERNSLIVTIRDDGVGFFVDLLDQTQSLGILGMRERALLLQAQFHLKSVPGHGTTITLRIPLEDADTVERETDEHIDR